MLWKFISGLTSFVSICTTLSIVFCYEAKDSDRLNSPNVNKPSHITHMPRGQRFNGIWTRDLFALQLYGYIARCHYWKVSVKGSPGMCMNHRWQYLIDHINGQLIISLKCEQVTCSYSSLWSRSACAGELYSLDLCAYAKYGHGYARVMSSNVNEIAV